MIFAFFVHLEHMKNLDKNIMIVLFEDVIISNKGNLMKQFWMDWVYRTNQCKSIKNAFLEFSSIYSPTDSNPSGRN
jgi:hypothetical protein